MSEPGREDEGPQDAVAWFARSRSGAMQADELARMADWLAQPLNHASYLRVERQWDALEQLRGHPAILAIGRDRGRRGMVLRSLGWLRVVAAALLVALMLRTDAPLLEAVQTIRFASDRSEIRNITMADGSLITLDAGSAVRVSMSGRLRRVDLETGRALFKVAHDPHRPFSVHAGDETVTALGTEFLVSEGASHLSVALIKGRIKVESGPASPRMMEIAPRTQIDIGRDGTWQVRKIDPAAALAWKSGQLVFDAAPLRDVVQEISRYSRRKLEIADYALAERKVTAVFQAGDLDTFAKALEMMDIATIRVASDGTLILSRKNNSL